MALDPSLSLIHWPTTHTQLMRLNKCEQWNKLLSKYRDMQWGVRMENGKLHTLDGEYFIVDSIASAWHQYFGEKWLLFQPNSGETLADAVIHLNTHGGNGYAVLETHGILVIDIGASGQLTGGSYCQTKLQQDKGRLQVVKQIDFSVTHQFNDSDLKLRREEEFMRSLPDNAKCLFAKYISSSESTSHFDYVTEFEYGYTLSELIFHERVSENFVLSQLADMYCNLNDTLYRSSHIPGNWSCQEPDVLSRAVRRLDIISDSHDPIAEQWASLIQAQEIQINGKQYEGWPKLRHWLLTDKSIEAMLNFGTAEMCHGDLILDDVVAAQSGNIIKLVDPNGDAKSRYYDVAKTYLSVFSFYEAFKYNRFMCELTGTDIHCTLPFTSPIATIEAICLGLPLRLRLANLWCEDYPEPGGCMLLLLNGLHNIALPMFHLLHHRAFERALAFFAIGIIRLNQARSVLKSGRVLSAEKVIETYPLRSILSV